MSGHPLDNPVFTSLTGAHRGLADVDDSGGLAARYQVDVADFGGLADAADAGCWEALEAVLAGGYTCVIAEPTVVPDGWETIMVIPGVQMDGTALEPAEAPDAITLGDDDVDEMLALVERTRPGPFLRRTNHMGRYIGIRQDGDLVAMAGERMHPPGWTEISAVCTDERCRGQGLGTKLVRAVAVGIRERDELPFLHAAASNVNAIRLYEALGFTIRRTCSFTVVRRARTGA